MLYFINFKLLISINNDKKSDIYENKHSLKCCIQKQISKKSLLNQATLESSFILVGRNIILYYLHFIFIFGYQSYDYSSDHKQ